MTNRPLNDDYGHRLFLFTDVRNAEWERNWRYLDATVSEVARSARVPLMMAQSLMYEAVAQPNSDAARALVEHAAKQLAKADITFERLSETLSVHQPPEVARCSFDVIQLLRHIIDDFPEDDAKCIAIEEPTALHFEIMGWPDRLSFVFRSLLAHMLTLRSSRGRVEIVTLLADSGDLCLTLKLSNTVTHESAAPPGKSDPLALAQRRAREMASLALDTLVAIAKRHNGTLSRTIAQGIPIFCVTLAPQASGEN